jgi:hypothetical protein
MRSVLDAVLRNAAGWQRRLYEFNAQTLMRRAPLVIFDELALVEEPVSGNVALVRHAFVRDARLYLHAVGFYSAGGELLPRRPNDEIEVTAEFLAREPNADLINRAALALQRATFQDLGVTVYSPGQFSGNELVGAFVYVRAGEPSHNTTGYGGSPQLRPPNASVFGKIVDAFEQILVVKPFAIGGYAVGDAQANVRVPASALDAINTYTSSADVRRASDVRSAYNDATVTFSGRGASFGPSLNGTPLASPDAAIDRLPEGDARRVLYRFPAVIGYDAALTDGDINEAALAAAPYPALAAALAALPRPIEGDAGYTDTPPASIVFAPDVPVAVARDVNAQLEEKDEAIRALQAQILGLQTASEGVTALQRSLDDARAALQTARDEIANLQRESQFLDRARVTAESQRDEANRRAREAAARADAAAADIQRLTAERDAARAEAEAASRGDVEALRREADARVAEAEARLNATIMDLRANLAGAQQRAEVAAAERDQAREVTERTRRAADRAVETADAEIERLRAENERLRAGVAPAPGPVPVVPRPAPLVPDGAPPRPADCPPRTAVDLFAEAQVAKEVHRLRLARQRTGLSPEQEEELARLEKKLECMVRD